MCVICVEENKIIGVALIVIAVLLFVTNCAAIHSESQASKDLWMSVGSLLLTVAIFLSYRLGVLSK